jgi:GT2 family glycosyltransferase
MKNFYELITITIVLYQENFELISKCLNGLNKFRIIIVDNSGDIKLKKKVQEKFEISEYIINNKNLGFSKALNQAIKKANTEFILNLEADCIIDEKNIHKLYKALISNKDCYICTPTMIDDNGVLTQSGGAFMEKNLNYKPIQLEGDICVDFPMTAAILFKKKEIMDLGLFDEDLFIYYPDCEIGRRIRKKKKSIIQIFDSVAIHTMGTLKIKNKLKNIFYRNYYFTLDGLIYFYKVNLHSPYLMKLKKKIPNYIVKTIINIFLFKYNKTIQYLAIILAYYNFKKKFLNVGLDKTK